ncbi:MAG: hypothetical protein R3F02_15535 [Thiolinea sp.]
MKTYKNFKRIGCLFLGAVSLLLTEVQAASFEVAVAPSRFELTGSSAERIGQSIDIHNIGRLATSVNVRTLDWTYSAEGDISYHEELLPGSCRPWVTIERNNVQIAPDSKKTFRFQISIPPNQQRQECRFMLAVEGSEPAHRSAIRGGGANLSMPVTGRIAVAVYIALNGAEPKMQMRQVSVKNIKGKRTPVLTVTNHGDAHGRLDGGLEVVDSRGVEFELVPEGTPVMPGQTRIMPLIARAVNGQNADMVYPVKGSGQIDWEKGSFKMKAEFK